MVGLPLVDKDDTTKGRRSDYAKAANPTQAMVSHSMIKQTAEAFISEFAAKTIMEDGNRQIWVCMNGIYEPFGEAIFRKLMTEADWPQADVNKVIKVVKTIATIRRKEFQIDLSHNFTFVNLANCVRNWKTGETFDPDPKYVFKYKFPVIFMGREQIVHYLLKWLIICL
jgi:hypothetical protein